jgi:DNA-binding MarR family transcriptional regulator
MTSSTPLATGYLLTKLGQLTTARFADRLAELDLRPKHFGLLLAIRSTPPGSQSELGQTMGLVPSAIVTILDDLEKRGAVVRTADPHSRRRFIVELTARGTELLNTAARRGDEVDAEILAFLSDRERAGLHRTLEKLALSHGLLPTENTAPNDHG